MFETPIVHTRGNLRFVWAQRSVVDIYRDGGSVPFECIGGDFQNPSEAQLADIAQKWIDAQPDGTEKNRGTFPPVR